MCSPSGPGRSCGFKGGGNPPVKSLMIRPYCFFSNVVLSICLYSVRLLALSCARRVWLRLLTFAILLAMNSFVGAVCGAVRDGGYVLIDSFGVFFPTEGAVYGFFPGECVRP